MDKNFSYNGNYTTDSNALLLACKKKHAAIVQEFIQYVEKYEHDSTDCRIQLSISVNRDYCYLCISNIFPAKDTMPKMSIETTLEIRDKFTDLTRRVFNPETGKTSQVDVKYRDFLHNPTVAVIKQLINSYM